MYLTFLRDPGIDVVDPELVASDYAVDDVFIGPDDAPGKRVQLVRGARPTGANVVEAIATRPTSAPIRALRHGLIGLLRKLTPDQEEGDSLEDFIGGSDLLPTQRQAERFFSSTSHTPPLMLNLLAYRDVVAYNRYGLVAARYLAHLGAEIVWSARVRDEAWDEVILVRYPSREAFRFMATRRAYQDAARRHRLRGLERTQLFVLSPRG